MTTQYSPILKLALPVQGELSGTWGDVVNDNITSMVEQAIAGRAVINTWTTNSHTLTSANGTTSESRCAMLELTDTGTALSGAGTVVCPTASKIYIVKNAAGQNITVKTSGGTGILVPNGRTTFLFCDGTNVVEALTHTTSLQLGTSTTVTAVLDEDDMASNSATSLATQQSIKAYVDSKVGQFDSLSEVLAVGNTTGSNNIIVDNGQKITTNTIDETTAGSGVTIDSVLLKDDGVNATNLEVTNIKANDGTAAGSIADSTGVVTVASAVLTTADINGGTADGVVIGGTTPAAATVTTAVANTSLTIAGTTTVTSILDEDNMASDDPAGLATQQSIKAYVDAQVGTVDTLAEVLANGNTTGGTDIAVSAGDDITFADSSKAIFGAGSDLQIYHDSASGNSFITESGSGNLKVIAQDFILNSQTPANMITAYQNAAVSLFYSGAAKLATTNTGVDITGTLVSDGLTVDGTATITETGNNNTLTLSSTDADANAGPNLLMFRDSASPAASDRLATITYRGKNDAAQNVDYIVYDSFISDASDGSEDATLDIRTILAGSEASRIALTPVETVINESGNDLDFRVESSNHDYAFFVDGASGGVQMGDSTQLTVGTPGHGRLALIRTNGSSQLNMFRADTSIAGGDTLGIITAYSNDTNGNAIVPVVKIAMTADGTFSANDNPTKLEFYTTPDASETIRQVGYFNNTGKFYANFGAEINTSQNNANGDFKVSSSSNANMLFVDAGSNHVNIGTADDLGGLLNLNSGDGSFIVMRGASNNTGYINWESNGFTFFTNGPVEALRIGSSETVVNEDGRNYSFRVESDAKQKMLFVDGGENVVAMGMLDNYTTPSWIGNGSVVMADNFYQFQGANTNDGVWNQSVDTNQSYHMHNAYYSGGWKQHVANVSATMYQSGSGLHRFQVANANASADQAISWRVLLDMNEADGFHWNANDYSTADFRVESDSTSHMFFVNAGDNAVGVNWGSPTEMFSVKDGNILLYSTTSYGTAPAQLKFQYNVAAGSNPSSGYITTIHSSQNTYSGNLLLGGRGYYSGSYTDVPVLTVSAYKRVGINLDVSAGYADPSEALHVRTSGSEDPYVLVDGSSSNRDSGYKINAGGGVDIAVRSDSAGNMFFGPNGDIKVDSSSNVVINDANADRDFRVASDSNANMFIVDAGGEDVFIGKNTSAPQTVGIMMNLDSAGGRISLASDNDSSNAAVLVSRSDTGGNTLLIRPNGNVQNQNNSYAAISDINKKENIADASSQWDDIKAVRVRKYSMIDDASATANQIGVIAQELQSAGMGGLVETVPDIYDPTQNDISVKYSILYMKAVKALQEAMDRIETLEAKVSALENA